MPYRSINPATGEPNGAGAAPRGAAEPPGRPDRGTHRGARPAEARFEVSVTADIARYYARNAAAFLAPEKLARFGRIDVLVNNAGLMPIRPMAEVNTDEWDAMIDIHVKGVLYGIAATLPVFLRQNSGHIINLSSVAGTKVFSPGGTVYSGTKFAVHAISEGLRHEVGNAVRVTSIAPGAVDSDLKLSTNGTAQAAVQDFYKAAIPAASVARAIGFAIEQPADVDINEIVLRPTAQEF